MSSSSPEKSSFDVGRLGWATIVCIFLSAILAVRLWFLQIYRGDHYSRASLNNIVRRVEVEAPRGVMYDRFGQVVVDNRPFYDLVLIPQYVKDREMTLQVLSQLLEIPVARFYKSIQTESRGARFQPVIVLRDLNLNQVGLIESSKVLLPGVEIRITPRRSYQSGVPVHMVGYVGEISEKTLAAQAEKHGNKNPYRPGDLVGKQGLELKWEPYLRGKRGHSYLQVDAFGRKTNEYFGAGTLDLPTIPATPGADLTLTLDLGLQKAVQKAFQGKYGAIIAMDPRNGEILAMLSSPGYDPKIYQEGISAQQWQALVNNPFKPLFDKTTGGAYPPGSIFKPVVGLAAMEEKIITPQTKHMCSGIFHQGRDSFHCHFRPGHGEIDLADALARSCDVYFYNLGVELGVDRIAKYAFDLGLGKKLDLLLNREDPGLIPTSAWKRQTFGTSWTLGDNPNLAIGQGLILATPLQMASLYATLANGGTVWRPHIIKRITNHYGEVLHEVKPEIVHKSQFISQQSFQAMRSMLARVISHPRGTGWRARIPGRTLAGKTGSVQVVALEKNRGKRQEAVSRQWQEHSIFVGFAPVTDPEIVIAVISEHDTEGGGGKSTAPITKEILEWYWNNRSEPLKLARNQGDEDGHAR